VTWLAVIVVPLVVPSTRTLSPFVIALAELELVPFWYVVEDASFTVTFWPADVVSVKPDPDKLSTVPDDPPAAGPDRAFDPPAPGMCCPGAAAAEVAAVAVPELPLEAALTMPAVPPPITTAAMPAARNLVAFREKLSFRVNIGGSFVDAIHPRLAPGAGTKL
jgi:hypothetical protein